MFAIKTGSESNHIRRGLELRCEGCGHGINLPFDEVARDRAFGPTFRCQSANDENALSKQGRGFFKPRPCGGLICALPLVQHKVWRSCHRACGHHSLKL